MSTYLITGGSGSLGTALTHHLLAKYHKVRTLSRNEHSRETLEKSVAAEHRKNLSCLTGDIRDLERVRLAMDGVDFVINAAALKIVPVAESDPNEAILTNIVGAMNVARAVVDTQSVERAIFIGTDKQIEATTLYGATKLCGIRSWLASNRYSPLRKPFVGVLYGNVMGSNGSILHIFRKQAESGLIKITDFASTRFHMRMRDAVNLVLDALHKSKSGELWVPKLKTYRVVDFAAVVAPGMKQEEIGLRPNEKVHETMVSSNESIYAVDQGNHFVLTPGIIQGKGGWTYHSGMPELQMNREQIKQEIVDYDAENVCNR